MNERGSLRRRPRLRHPDLVRVVAGGREVGVDGLVTRESRSIPRLAVLLDAVVGREVELLEMAHLAKGESQLLELADIGEHLQRRQTSAVFSPVSSPQTKSSYVQRKADDKEDDVYWQSSEGTKRSGEPLTYV